MAFCDWSRKKHNTDWNLIGQFNLVKWYVHWISFDLFRANFAIWWCETLYFFQKHFFCLTLIVFDENQSLWNTNFNAFKSICVVIRSTAVLLYAHFGIFWAPLYENNEFRSITSIIWHNFANFLTEAADYSFNIWRF